ncbi:MAG TPA: polysaccharide deacetylase family protein [Candidatus Omnitrophota bacterium]|nr:polysaccharide deacetylase family protein [Candidatus Omnitrophota bacterium]
MNKILMYHSIGGKGTGEIGSELYSIPVETFRKQMELVAKFNRDKKPEEQIIITFDDGLIDNYTSASPILREFGLKAYFFVIYGLVGTPGYMNWEQVVVLQEYGMTIGSHGMTHKFLNDLNEEDLIYELGSSRKLMRDWLKDEIENFSVPRGFVSKKVLKIAKGVGYKKVFTSNYLDHDGYCFGRIAVKAGWSVAYFERVIKYGLPFQAKVAEAVKRFVKKVFGASVYDRARSKIIKARS